MTAPIKYHPKWKETLVGSIEENIFYVEMTMGTLHVYFPTEEAWNASAPLWARDKWEAAKEAAKDWCREQNIPLTIDNAAWVDFIGTEDKKGEKV